MLFETKSYSRLIISILTLLLPVGCDKLGGSSDTDLTESEKMEIWGEGWTKFHTYRAEEGS